MSQDACCCTVGMTEIILIGCDDCVSMFLLLYVAVLLGVAN